MPQVTVKTKISTKTKVLIAVALLAAGLAAAAGFAPLMQKFAPPLTVTVLSPKDGAILSGGVELSAAASSPVPRLDFAADHAQTGAGYGFVGEYNAEKNVWYGKWDTTKYPNGEYKFAAAAYTYQGTKIPSKSIGVKVQNAISFKTKPSVTLVPLPTTTLIGGEQVLMRFSVAADLTGDLSLKKMVVMVDKTAAPDLSTTAVTKSVLRRVGDAANIAGTTSLWQCGAGGTVCTITTSFANEEVVAAGTSRNYEVRALVSGPLVVGDSVKSRLEGEPYYPTAAVGALGGTAPDLLIDGSRFNFIWSDISALPHSDVIGSSSADWINGKPVTGLPTAGQTLLK